MIRNPFIFQESQFQMNTTGEEIQISSGTLTLTTGGSPIDLHPESEHPSARGQF